LSRLADADDFSEIALVCARLKMGTLSERAINRHDVEIFNKLHDLSYSYELLNFYMHGRSKDGRGETRL
jgi:hypothetical protein